MVVPMPDLGPAFGAILELFGPVIGAALKALLRTVFGMLLLGAAVMGGTIWYAAQGSWLRGLIAGALCGIALTIVTGVLAVKNAVMRGLLHGIEKLGLSARLLRMLFNQLGVTDESELGERAGAVGRAVERIPLAEAEKRLRGAVEALLSQRAAKPGMRAWLARKVMAATLERVEAVTLARFRADGAALGGVDLRVVRDELGVGLDEAIGNTIASKLNALNIVIAGLFVAFSVLIAVAVAHLQV